MRRLFLILATLLIFLAPRSAAADPIAIFNTFGPGDTYSPGAGPILGPGFPMSEGDVTPGQWFASSFLVPTGVFEFTGVDLALSVLNRFGEPASPVNVTLRLVAGVAGLPGTTALEMMSTTAVTSLFDGGSIESVASSLRPVLTGGMEYWLIASTLDEAEGAGWMGSFTDNRPLPSAIRRVDGDWTRGSPNGAFRVYAQRLDSPAPVPEPATMALAGLGLAAVARSVRRRQRPQR
jgi:hypothetical protein